MIVEIDGEMVEVTIRPRPMETINLEIPRTALEMLERVAAERDTSVHGLLKMYISHALREDWRAFFPNVVSPAAQELLHRRTTSPD